MASIKLAGDTSGEITISAPSVAGTNTLTLPATTGNVVTDSATQTLTNKTLTTPNVDSAQFATVSGTAPLYAARAWVNFNGTGTVAIRESGNVSSITDNGTGDYTVNFTTAMPDADYSSVFSVSENLTNPANRGVSSNWTSAPSSSAVRIRCVNSTNTATDMLYVHAAIFR
jgi:hypothetical protein